MTAHGPGIRHDEHGLFLCRSCGHRAEVEIDTSAEVFVDEAAKQSPLTSLGLVRCPACGRRDRKVVLVEALLPTALGALLAPVLGVVTVLAGMIAIAGPDVHENDARFPFLLAGAGLAAVLGWGGLVAWYLGRAFRRAAQNVTFGRTAPQGEPPYRARPALPAVGRPSFLVPVEQRSNLALGIVTTSALGVALLGHGASLPAMIGVGVAAALVAGAIRGDGTAERAVFSVAFVASEAGIIVATRRTQRRGSLWNVELLFPLVVGALPGVGFPGDEDQGPAATVARSLDAATPRDRGSHEPKSGEARRAADDARLARGHLPLGVPRRASEHAVVRARAAWRPRSVR